MIGAGYYEISMSDYLADPCPEPALSTKIVSALVKQTAQRAKMIHPRLNPEAFDASPRADIGSAVHAKAHGGYPLRYVEAVSKRSGKDAGVMFVPTDWATQDAKDARDEIRAAGGIPLLPKDREGVEAAGLAVQRALEEFGPGKHEQSMFFQCSGFVEGAGMPGHVWARCRADWLSDGPVQCEGLDAPNGVDCDTKTCDNADAASWVKTTLYNGDLDVQMGLRHLAHIALTGKPRKMLWLLVEYEAPFDTCWVGASEEVIELAVRKVKHAARLWRRCLDEQRWPGNARSVQWAAPPTWALWDAESRGIA